MMIIAVNFYDFINVTKVRVSAVYKITTKMFIRAVDILRGSGPGGS
jgi:hypothetical protein